MDDLHLFLNFMQDQTLAKIDALDVALAQATTVQETKKIHDAALGIEVFIKHQKASQAERNRLIEIILHSCYKLGEMLIAAKAAGQMDSTRYLKKGSVVPIVNDGEFSLEQAGIDRRLSMQAQRLVKDNPKDKFLKAISEAKENGTLSKNMFSKKANAIEPKEFKPHPQRDEIVGLHSLGKNQTEIAEETGTSHDAVYRVIEQERIKAAYEPEIILSLTAQQKLERAIEKEKRRLAAEFHSVVNARVKQFLADTIGPQLKKEQKEAQWIMKSRKGVMTRKQFNSIRACLHTDRRPTDQELNAAFSLFSSFEKYLLKEAESPTAFTRVPSTMAEWDELKRKATEARRRKSKTRESSIQKK